MIRKIVNRSGGGGFGGKDEHLRTGFKLQLDDDADTYITCPSDDAMDFYVGGNQKLRIGSNFLVYANAFLPSATGKAIGSTSLPWHDTWMNGKINIEVDTDGDAPADGSCDLYSRTTGGKEELVVRFPTGAVQQIKIEA